MSEVDLATLEPCQENADKYFPPQDIGPIWQKDTFGQWIYPEQSLGWEAVVWAETNLRALRGNGMLRLTEEQVRVILWMYALNDNGDFTYEYAVYQAFKGAGKDPFGAVLCIIELIGPCRFSHWEYDEDGNKHPVATDEPDALVQLVGVSKSQTNNTMRNMPKLLGKEVTNAYNLDIQREIIYVVGTGKKLEMVGSNYTALEGNPVTFALMNETQHWLPSQSGIDLYDTLYDNVGKTPGARFLCITNAYEPGRGSAAEKIRTHVEKVWAGREPDAGWLYMSREAHPKAPLDAAWVPFIMERIIGDAWWQRSNMRSIVLRVLDRSRPASRIRRMYYNQIVASEHAFFSPQEWDGAWAEGCTGRREDLNPGDEIVLGFDGGKTDDATALVAIRIKDKLIVPLVIEQKPDGPDGDTWKVDEHIIDSEVHYAFQTFKVRAFFADPALWQSYIAAWSEEYREVLQVKAAGDSSIAWDMSGNHRKVASTWELYRAAIINGQLKHNGDKFLRMHALNAHLGHNKSGMIARKDGPESPRKIDAMVASYVAYAALQAYLERGKREKTTRRTMLRDGAPEAWA